MEGRAAIAILGAKISADRFGQPHYAQLLMGNGLGSANQLMRALRFFVAHRECWAVTEVVT